MEQRGGYQEEDDASDPLAIWDYPERDGVQHRVGLDPDAVANLKAFADSIWLQPNPE
jgi:hypothetical protein